MDHGTLVPRRPSHLPLDVHPPEFQSVVQWFQWLLTVSTLGFHHYSVKLWVNQLILDCVADKTGTLWKCRSAQPEKYDFPVVWGSSWVFYRVSSHQWRGRKWSRQMWYVSLQWLAAWSTWSQIDSDGKTFGLPSGNPRWLSKSRNEARIEHKLKREDPWKSSRWFNGISIAIFDWGSLGSLAPPKLCHAVSIVNQKRESSGKSHGSGNFRTVRVDPKICRFGMLESPLFAVFQDDKIATLRVIKLCIIFSTCCLWYVTWFRWDELLQETPLFHGKFHGFRFDVPFQSIFAGYLLTYVQRFVTESVFGRQVFVQRPLRGNRDCYCCATWVRRLGGCGRWVQTQFLGECLFLMQYEILMTNPHVYVVFNNFHHVFSISFFMFFSTCSSHIFPSFSPIYAGGGASQRGHLQLVAGRQVRWQLALAAGAAEWNGRSQAATRDLDDVLGGLTCFNHMKHHDLTWFNMIHIFDFTLKHSDWTWSNHQQ